jgi:hypothetical protein
MPLSAALSSLESDIESAYQTCKSDGSEDGADSDSVISQLAQDLADAVHAYMTSALVTTTVTVDTGQMDAVGGSTITEGSGAGTGNLS